MVPPPALAGIYAKSPSLAGDSVITRPKLRRVQALTPGWGPVSLTCVIIAAALNPGHPINS